jgi:AcrR family transcriptional regulator
MRAALTRAERQANTRRGLVDAAERLFTAQGFHPTSLDAVADEAGYTKGAVYSNFASKEDLFFAVYERRVERYLENVERTLARNGGPDQAVLAIIAETAARREHDDGWLAVFLEFWTHVLRHPEHRARFAAIHARAIDPFAAILEEFAAERQVELPLDTCKLAVAFFAAGTALGLERLTQPDVVDGDLMVRMQELWFEALARGLEGPRKGGPPPAAPPTGAPEAPPKGD